MTSISKSTTYDVVWQFKDKPHIKITRCKKVINFQSSKILKRTLKGAKIGYWISSKDFIKEKDINCLVEKIPKIIKCPF